MFLYCVVLALVAVPTIYANGQKISTVELGTNKYYISNANPFTPELNWFLAYQYCRSIGMELLTLKTIEEENAINDYLSSNNYGAVEYWTSGNIFGTSMWLWMSTGAQYNSTFNSWANGRTPSKGTSGQHCMAIESSVWNAKDCDAKKPFICELTRCFYYNYVTTNKAPQSFSQGNRRKSSPVRSRPSNPSNFKQTEKSTNNDPPTRPNSKQNENEKESNPIRNRVEARNNRPLKIMPTTETPSPLKVMPTVSKIMPVTAKIMPIKIMSTTPKIMATTSAPLKVMPTIKQMPVKIMPAKIMPAKIMPTKIMPAKIMPGQLPNEIGISISQNEIIPNIPRNITDILPPIFEFQPGTLDSPSTPDSSAFELARKEMFSWALKSGN